MNFYPCCPHLLFDIGECSYRESSRNAAECCVGSVKYRRGLFRTFRYGLKIIFTPYRRLRPRDPWVMQLKLQQTGQGAGESPAP